MTLHYVLMFDDKSAGAYLIGNFCDIGFILVTCYRFTLNTLHDQRSIYRRSFMYKFVIHHFQRFDIVVLANKHFLILTNQKLCKKTSGSKSSKIISVNMTDCFVKFVLRYVYRPVSERRHLHTG